jgi:hypothetical protein
MEEKTKFGSEYVCDLLCKLESYEETFKRFDNINKEQYSTIKKLHFNNSELESKNKFLCARVDILCNALKKGCNEILSKMSFLQRVKFVFTGKINTESL